MRSIARSTLVEDMENSIGILKGCQYWGERTKFKEYFSTYWLRKKEVYHVHILFIVLTHSYGIPTMPEHIVVQPEIMYLSFTHLLIYWFVVMGMGVSRTSHACKHQHKQWDGESKRISQIWIPWQPPEHITHWLVYDTSRTVLSNLFWKVGVVGTVTVSHKSLSIPVTPACNSIPSPCTPLLARLLWSLHCSY